MKPISQPSHLHLVDGGSKLLPSKANFGQNFGCLHTFHIAVPPSPNSILAHNMTHDKYDLKKFNDNQLTWKGKCGQDSGYRNTVPTNPTITRTNPCTHDFTRKNQSRKTHEKHAGCSYNLCLRRRTEPRPLDKVREPNKERKRTKENLATNQHQQSTKPGSFNKKSRREKNGCSSRI